ncbi:MULTISPECIES: DUF3486 family protein [Yersinia pseudotuberculosis complex]|uniref:DUF3486 family protein n=1 Tax=Yersinia pseudotuberculosis complex TaxID=1649845 RepID=UPI0005E2FC22|nr:MULTISPECIES: DUF3486 family protein [Yersinia pseudotuberculosis complex]MBO1554572.1 DUF3486 family protein [Yersinia pseudotuberculosis]CNC37770.1 Protein of uncharacterised function (DUF3486) [Yersinia similis]CNK24028.1 Protein of uncharacterised function (DUF3486) [Yersinia pseudotuberculosis]CRY70838.1 Protein of uncharacterised function (DUF3486) [Yersinia pseudotuberculosis]SUQ18068.1 Protein of uncharacterised function (DUF3486) [Yersinia pseudotuberculosis]
MGRRSTIDRLPIEVRHWLERALTENGFSGYQDLEELLHEKGFQISKSAIFRYGKKIEKRFATIKASTEAARILTEGAPDDQDKRSEAIIGIVQSELFDTLLNLQEASEADDQESRIKLLAAAAKNIAALTRASVNLKRYQADIRKDARAELLREQNNNLNEAAKTQGMGEEQVQFWRERILGIR